MIFAKKEIQLTYDDVLIVPTKCLDSRKDVTLDNIIIPAPMDTVSNEQLCKEQLRNGGLAILHRYKSLKDKVDFWNLIPDKNSLFIGCGIDAEEIEKLLFAGIKNFCIDVANGHNDKVARAIEYIKFHDNTKVITGNVATPQGFEFLADIGADFIRCGIGGGSLCTTRLVTGCGVPNVSCLDEIVQKRKNSNVKIIADGGIRNSGDIVKALALGADYVMAGSLFAGCDECGMSIINGWVEYRGMASVDAQFEAYGKKPIAPEGVSTSVKSKGKFEDVLNGLLAGVKSGMSYVYAKNINELRQNARFIQVSSNTLIENRPHLTS